MKRPFFGSFDIVGYAPKSMDEEDKHLLKELASIMQKIEQKGLLELANANISGDIVPENNEKESDDKSPEQEITNTWKTFYDSNVDPDFKIAHGGKTLALEITRSKKRADFFRKLHSIAIADWQKRNAQKEKVRNAIGLVKISNPLFNESDFPSPVPLPNESKVGTYILCRICYASRSRAQKYLRIYFSKAWSEKISSSIDVVPGQEFAIEKIWTLENTSKVLLPCKAVYRWESSNELVINAPPWLGLVGATKKDNSIWIRYRDDDGNDTRGHLSKRGKGNTLFRCSRKEPWDFYQSMKKKRTSKKETGVIDLMVAFNPETVF